jgi:serine/threonine-protein kinase
VKQASGPERFGKYTVSGVLGRGAMGAVYKAFDPDIKRPVAIKSIRWDLLQEGGPAGSIGARFRNEAQAAGRLAHPGIVAVYEYGQSNDCAFIAMEYVEGCDLREYFARKTAFKEADIVSIMVQLLDALGHAHERSVWHRDIKPANLIIMNDGRLKIADFGIARIQASDITQTFPLMGTHGYIAPEMYGGQGVDHRADVFAAGAVMYQLMAGKPPFDGPAEKVMFKVCNEAPASLIADDRSGRWAPYDAVVMKALAKAPEARFQTASSFRDAILAAYAQPVDATVSEATVIVSSGAGHSSRDAGRSSTAKAGPGSGSTGWPPGWDPGTLGSVENRLARVVGPMARVLVRRAARTCTDLDALLHILADRLDIEDRQAFLASAPTGSAKATEGRSPARSAPEQALANSGAGAEQKGLGSWQIERAAQLLATYIGPAARMIVKHASDRTSDPEQFYRLVAARIPSEPDREAFLRNVRVAR